MTLPLFDAQCGFGGAEPGGQVVSADELRAEMGRLHIDRALVRTLPEALASDLRWANDRLLEAAATDDRLTPCPIVVPSHAGDVPPEAEQVSELIERGARAVAIRPAKDNWTLEPWACAELLAELARRRLPVVCSVGTIPLEQVARLAGDRPTLQLILVDVSYRQLRTLVPLLATFANVWLALGTNFAIHRGIERLVERVGAGQLLFGTGWPAVEAMPAMTQLTYAELADDDREGIAHGNLERLLGEVVQ